MEILCSFLRALLATLILSSVSAGDDVSSLYNEGNRLYREGDYAEAIVQYEKVLSAGVRNADVYYNLGNAYYKDGSLGSAVLHYERARRLNPSDPDIIENIEYLNAIRVDRFDLDPPNAVTRFLQSGYSMLSPNLLTVMIGLAFLLACAAGGGWIYSDRNRIRYLAVTAFALLVCSTCGVLLAAKVSDLNADKGIVMTEEAEGRSGPGEDYLKVFTLHEGTKVVIERKEGRWGLVRLPNGIGGWITLDGLGVI